MFPKYNIKSKDDIKCELDFVLNKDVPIMVGETQFTLSENCYVNECMATNVSAVVVYVPPAFCNTFNNPKCTYKSDFLGKQLRINNLKGCFLQFVAGQLLIEHKRNKRNKYVVKGTQTIDLFDIDKKRIGDISTANAQLILDHTDKFSLFTQDYLHLIDNAPTVVKRESEITFKAETHFIVNWTHDQNNVINPKGTMPGIIAKAWERGKNMAFYAWENTKNMACKLIDSRLKYLNLQNIQIVDKNKNTNENAVREPINQSSASDDIDSHLLPIDSESVEQNSETRQDLNKNSI